MNRLILLLLLILIIHLNAFTEVNEHKLEKGETLYRVSKKYNVPLDILVKVNRIKDVTKLKVGSKIIIPETYTIKKGETVYGIARAYNISPDLLIGFNSISDPTKIQSGDIIYIPLSASTKAPKIKSESADKEAAAVFSKENRKNILWPVNGEKEKLRGKITGVLIKSSPGMKVMSVSTGVVIWSSPYRGYGRVVFIESRHGYIYGYLGNSETYVKVAEKVSTGTILGKLGINAHDNKAQLIFVVYKNGKPINPYNAPRG